MEERLELVKIIEQDQENWKRLIDIIEKLAENRKKKDNILLNVLEQMEKEKQRGDEIQEILNSIQEITGNMKEGFEKNENKWEEWGKSVEEGLIQQVSSSIQKISEDMKEGFRKNEGKWEEWEKSKSQEHELKSCKDMIEKLTEEKKELETQIEQMKKQEKEKVDLEDKEFRELYERYKAWTGEEKRKFATIKEDSFFDFFISCSGESLIGYVFEGLGTLIWTEEDEEGKEIMDKVIDFCIDIQRRKGVNLQRQNVKEGDQYSGNSHQKREGDPIMGFVRRVLFQGVKNERGEIFKKCKSFVEIEE